MIREVEDELERQMYEIVRYKLGEQNEVIETDVTLEEAQKHCSREDTHGDGWFDGYRKVDEEWENEN